MLVPQVGKSVWALELLQQCKNFFGIIVLQFVGHLLGGSMVNLRKQLYDKASGGDGMPAELF